MAKTVVGLFENSQKAESALRDLLDAGFRRDDISVTARSEGSGESISGSAGDDDRSWSAGTGAATGASVGAALGGVGGLLVGLGVLAIPGLGPIVAAGPLVAALTGAGVGAAAGGLVGGLIGLGIPKEHAEAYEEGVRRGGYLVIVNARDEDADRAAEILDRHDPIDIDERAARDVGFAGAEASTAAVATAGTTTGRDDYIAPAATQGEAHIPIVEEQLAVGKRAVALGTVRVRSYVVEKPVSAEVALTEQVAHIERRPVDRPLTGSEAAFEERVVEVVETAEKPVVSKEQHVVEEVIVGTQTTEHRERVEDTVRRTEVEVEKSAETKRRVGDR